MMGSISVSVSADGIATISFDHPSHNSLTSELLGKLRTALLDCGENAKVKIILIRSEGNRTFCAGANMTELATVENTEDGTAFFLGFAQVINAIRTCGKIVVCRVQGKVVGGGVGLIAACDYAMATKWASIRLSELAIGIGPFVIAPAIERKVGLALLKKLALNPGEWQTAQRCFELGFYEELFDTPELMDAYLERYLNAMIGYSTPALAQMKQMLWEGTEDWETLLYERAKVSGQLVVTPEAQRAIKKIVT